MNHFGDFKNYCAEKIIVLRKKCLLTRGAALTRYGAHFFRAKRA